MVLKLLNVSLLLYFLSTIINLSVGIGGILECQDLSRKSWEKGIQAPNHCVNQTWSRSLENAAQQTMALLTTAIGIATDKNQFNRK